MLWDWLKPFVDEGNPILLPVWVRIAGAFALGWVVAAVHFATTGRRAKRTERSLMATLVLLAVLIAVLTLVVGNSQARAFSLVGALSIIRFRTVVEDTRDTAFVIYAVVGGMGAGTGLLLGLVVPLACAPLVLLTSWVFRPRRQDAGPAKGTLVLRLGAGRPLDEGVQSLLRRHLHTYRLTGLSTARGGTALDVTYAVLLPAPEEVFALVNELGSLEGVQSVELKED